MRRPLLASAIIYCVTAVALTRLPLFNYLGYEFAASIALLVPWVAGLATIKSLSGKYSSAAPSPGEFLASIFSSMRRNVLLLILPLAIITLNAFFVKNCSYAEGIIFFLLIPVVTVIFSCALAGVCYVLWRRAYLMFIVLNIAILCYPLYIGWITPQIYSYSFIYGFFPGISYDEIIEISSHLVLFRLVTLTASLFMIFLGMFFLKHGKPGSSLVKRIYSLKNLFTLRSESIGSILVGIILLLVWVYRAQLGFESPAPMIQKTLSVVLRTEHFRIHYAPGSFSDDEARWLAAEHEYRFQLVQDKLKEPSPLTIDSYIYPDAETKRQFIGTGTTNIAKPWRKEIHLNIDAWEGTLEHELVHVVAGNFGMPVIRANYNMGIVEGLAMAIDEDYGNRTLHQYAASMVKFDLIRDPGKLISPSGFMLHASSVSYVLMGSFCKYLIDRYGILRFKQLYGGKSPSMVYGASFDQLTVEWEHYLRRIEVPDEWKNHVQYFFNRPSIFAKECARAIARMNDAGWKSIEQSQPEKAMGQFSLSLQKSWNTEAFNGLVRSAYLSGKYDTIIALMKQRRQDSSSVSNLLLYYGDALWHNNDTVAARSVYWQIASLDLSDRFDEIVAVRLLVFDDPTLRTALPAYIMGKLNDSAAAALFTELKKKSANPVLNYLNAKFLIKQKQYQAAIDELHGIKTDMGNPLLNGSKERWMAECYFQMHKFQQARMHQWQSLNYITNEASVNRIEENVDRCEWYSRSMK